MTSAFDKSTSDTATTLGTPCSKRWDAEWIDAVNKTEAEVGHRCCGAHAPDGHPCQLQSDNPNGRCRFHGGAVGIGAPHNNTNARIHGLYSRRLQSCGDHCPQWKSCPFAGADILKLKAAQRPLCAYEQAEFEVLTQLEEDSAPQIRERYEGISYGDPHPMIPEITSLRQNLKTLQIMITRATAASKEGLTQDTDVQAEHYSMTTSKPSAALQALQIITREHRSTLTLYERLIQKYGHPAAIKMVPHPHPEMLEEGYIHPSILEMEESDRARREKQQNPDSGYDAALAKYGIKL